MRANVKGCPAIIFSRHHEADKTKIRPAEDRYAPHKTCKTVEGLDANSLYLSCLCEEMASGFLYRRRSENNFRLEKTNPISQVAVEWLSYVEQTENIKIDHIGKHGRERQVGGKRLRVDGKCGHVLFEMDGCYFHGHCCRWTEHVKDKTKFEEIRKKTVEKHAYLRGLGYDLRVMRECEWLDFKNANPHKFRDDRSQNQKKVWQTKALTEAEIVDLVKSGDMFGFVEVDISVPVGRREFFKEFCPLFKQADVSIHDISPLMKTFAAERGIMRQPRRSLISSYFAEKSLIATPLLKWYLEMGLEVTKVYQVAQYTPAACFKRFGDTVTAARREAAIDDSKAIIGSTYKLLGNSSYGRTLMRKDLHCNIQIVEEHEAQRLVNDPMFQRLIPVNENLYEVVLRKKGVRIDLPLQIGLMVYDRAKLSLLKFYYNFLDRFVARSNFELVLCDTDSLYVSLSGDSLEHVIKPSERGAYEVERDRWLPSNRCTRCRHFISAIRTPLPLNICCATVNQHQQREPGLWKLETKADKIIALAPKSYICSHNSNNTEKLSCKGVQKRINPLVYDNYNDVLMTKTNHCVVNRGIRPRPDQRMWTYVQNKTGLSYLYIKRKVLDDGVSTEPLDL